MSRKRILIADDETNIQTMVRVCLAGDGHKILMVADGRAALDAVRRWSPDLLLLDLSTPVMDGISVLRELQVIDRGGSSSGPVSLGDRAPVLM